MGLDRHRQEWDELAASDPLWAILSDPERRHGQWDIEEFFATGAHEMAAVMARAATMALPGRRELALDFGCGVGRVTRAMMSYFDRCIGVDVSEGMVDSATTLNDGVARLAFVHNQRPDLTLFEDTTFDLVYSNIVLQHLPNNALVDSYMREFVRVLRPDGLLVFQLPDAIPLRRRIQPRPRMYALLRRLGVPASALQERLGLHPIRMRAASGDHVRTVITAARAHVIDMVGHRGIDGDLKPDILGHQILGCVSRPDGRQSPAACR